MRPELPCLPPPPYEAFLSPPVRCVRLGQAGAHLWTSDSSAPGGPGEPGLHTMLQHTPLATDHLLILCYWGPSYTL